MSEPLVKVENVSKRFASSEKRARGQGQALEPAVDCVSLTIKEGGTFGLVGESGSGKTTLARVILGLLRPSSGTVTVGGRDPADRRKRVRNRIQIVFQDPYSSLNPRMRVGQIIAEALGGNGGGGDEVKHWLELVGLPQASARAFPHEFSGGQRQRIAIARALAPKPALVILDEPTSALDVSIRAQIINLLRDLQTELQTTYLVISHDLDAVKHLSDEIGVMHRGRLVESGARDSIFDHPRHPYTQLLLTASSLNMLTSSRRGEALHAEMGCRFVDRCQVVMPVCREQTPIPVMANGTMVRCHLYPSGREENRPTDWSSRKSEDSG